MMHSVSSECRCIYERRYVYTVNKVGAHSTIGFEMKNLCDTLDNI